MNIKYIFKQKDVQFKLNQVVDFLQSRFSVSHWFLIIAFTIAFLTHLETVSAKSSSAWILANTGSSCANQAANFFFLGPYSARTDPSEEGGTVNQVANDGFTALGLSYHMGAQYDDELSEWLDTDLCLIQRLWPTRTVLNVKSSDYVGSAGSLVRANNRKICNALVAPSTASQPISPICEEIADASDAQMDQWVSQIEDNIEEVVNDPSLNQRIVAWYLGPEELREWIPREKELLQRIYHSVKELDPLNRPALLYIPGHYNTNNRVVQYKMSLNQPLISSIK